MPVPERISDYLRCAEIGIAAERVRDSATRREVSWSKPNFCWAMFPCRRRNVTWAVSSGSGVP